MLNVVYTHRKKARAMQMIQREEKTESERKKAFEEHTAESESDTRGLIINTSAEM